MKITLAQVAPCLGDINANVKQADRVIARAVTDGSDLVVFPELSLSGYSLGVVSDDVAIEAADPRLLSLADQAGPRGLLLGFPESGVGVHVYNSAAFYEGGGLVHVHRKLYLPTYGPFEERKHFTPGASMRAYPTRHGRIATLTCNDAWQPQLAFVAVQDGARILLMPTNSAQSTFPRRYDSHTYWQDITRFYARMFECYVVFVNRVGTENEMAFWGGSHVVDPWGETIAQLALAADEVRTVEIDLANVRLRRREVPLVKEARLAVLQRELQRLIEEGGDL
ncbi:MAG: nitrilase-related carbon-nitrogen hydrolase [Egibacteraceae bacterium]